MEEGGPDKTDIIRAVDRMATSQPNPDMLTWNKMVETASSAEKFRNVIEAMFEDGKYTKTRIKVLEYYMTDVCKTYPQISSEVQEVFSNFVRQVKEKKSREGNYCTLI